jgi:hypothetical protein
MSDDPLLVLRLAHFEALVGKQLQINFGQGAIPATITKASAIGGHTTRPDGGFSVTLLANVGADPQQGTFIVQLPDFGDLGLFMSPRKRVADQTEYEIVFN